MTPYETTVNRQFSQSIRDIKNTIEEQVALGKESLFKISPSERTAEVAWDNESIDHWAHPFYFNDLVYFDTRLFYNSKGGVKNMTEQSLMALRAKIEWYWVKQPEVFESMISPLSLVFAEWISGAITQRFNASEIDRSIYKIIAATYYSSLIIRAIEGSSYRLDRELLEQTASRIVSKQGGGIPSDYYYEVMGSITGDVLFETGFPTLTSLAGAIKTGSTVKLGNVDVKTLLQVMGGGSWIGNDALSLSLMALEHPPVLAMMVSRAAEMSSYRNKTRIGRAINNIRRQARIETVVNAVDRMSD